MHRKAHRSCAGLGLPEAVGSLVIFALLMGALTFGTASLFKAQARPSVLYQSQTYTLAPSFGDFHTAVNLHAAFAVAVDQSDSLIVLGGTRSHPQNDPNGPASPLALNFNAASLTAGAGADPAAFFSSWDQKQLNLAQFSSYLSNSNDPGDFTVLTVQGQSRITSITQQRRHTSNLNGENVVMYEVTFQAFAWGTGQPVAGSTYQYRIYYDQAEDHWSVPPGATHYWYRTDNSWNRDQEGPARVIFADPYVLAGQDQQSQVTAVSRFVYFLPVCR